MMLLPQPFQCDECKTQMSAKTDGWFLGVADAVDVCVTLGNVDKTLSNGSGVFAWDDDVARFSKVITHLCSVGCAAKWLSKQIDAPAVSPSER